MNAFRHQVNLLLESIEKNTHYKLLTSGLITKRRGSVIESTSYFIQQVGIGNNTYILNASTDLDYFRIKVYLNKITLAHDMYYFNSHTLAEKIFMESPDKYQISAPPSTPTTPGSTVESYNLENNLIKKLATEIDNKLLIEYKLDECDDFATLTNNLKRLIPAATMGKMKQINDLIDI